MDEQIKQAYDAGFRTACARMGIDPDELCKMAEGLDARIEPAQAEPKKTKKVK